MAACERVFWPDSGKRPQLRCLANITSRQSLVEGGLAARHCPRDASHRSDHRSDPFAWSTRRDLLLEVLALRHQLGVLARSNRRFRPADRLAWLILRRVWPRWQDALMLVRPATVDRWHRDGFSRWWPRRTRRPGRPRIDAECRPSERTVSRYMRERPRGSSQTWRTFLANHYDQLTSSSPEWPAPGADEVVDDACRVRHTPLSPDARYRSHQPAVVKIAMSRVNESHPLRLSFTITFTTAQFAST